jgi:hypothetical protein
MKTNLARIGALVVLLACPVKAGPIPTAGLQSYSKARAALDNGVRAIGGAEALHSTKTVLRRLSGGWVDTGQGAKPFKPTSAGTMPPSHEKDQIESFLDYDGQRWFESLLEANFSGDHAVQTDVVTRERGFETLAFIGEKPLYQEFARDDLPALLARKFRRYPEGALLAALARPETLQWVGQGSEGGRGQEVISFTDTMGARVMLYFDDKTNLLTKWETLRDHPVAGDSNTELVFDDYRPVGPLRLPFRYVDRTAGVPTEVLDASAIERNVGSPEDRFKAPTDFHSVERDPPEPRVEKLADSLYLIRGSHNSVFAVFNDYVVVLEAAVSSEYAEKCLKLIRETVPNKPIRYLVSTHFHFDHVAGVRPFIAQGVPILTTPDAKQVIKDVAEGRHTMHPDMLSLHPRAPTIETITDHRVIADDAHRLELYEFGPTEHVAQVLLAYFPNEKLLFEPDLLDITSKELVIGVGDTLIMDRKIRALGLDVQRIIPVHGIPGTAETLRAALALRAKYIH